MVDWTFKNQTSLHFHYDGYDAASLALDKGVVISYSSTSRLSIISISLVHVLMIPASLIID